MGLNINILCSSSDRDEFLSISRTGGVFHFHSLCRFMAALDSNTRIAVMVSDNVLMLLCLSPRFFSRSVHLAAASQQLTPRTFFLSRACLPSYKQKRIFPK
jgi:hypothetical protein